MSDVDVSSEDRDVLLKKMATHTQELNYQFVFRDDPPPLDFEKLNIVALYIKKFNDDDSQYNVKLIPHQAIFNYGENPIGN